MFCFAHKVRVLRLGLLQLYLLKNTEMHSTWRSPSYYFNVNHKTFRTCSWSNLLEITAFGRQAAGQTFHHYHCPLQFSQYLFYIFYSLILICASYFISLSNLLHISFVQMCMLSPAHTFWIQNVTSDPASKRQRLHQLHCKKKTQNLLSLQEEALLPDPALLLSPCLWAHHA